MWFKLNGLARIGSLTPRKLQGAVWFELNWLARIGSLTPRKLQGALWFVSGELKA